MANRTAIVMMIILLVAVSAGCSATYARLLPDDGGDDLILDPTVAETLTLRLFFPQGQFVFAEEREVTISGGSVKEAAVLALLQGPESSSYKEPFPEGTQLISVEVADEVAYVNLNAAAQVGGGTPYVSQYALRSLVFTLTELGSVHRVQVLIEGKTPLVQPRDPLLSSLIPSEPMGRDELGGESISPTIVASSDQIKLFWPQPDTLITGTLTLWGMAQVYEGTVSYELLVNGEAVMEGFTTASDLDWGSFQESVPLDTDLGDRALLRVYSQSAKDGTATHVVEVPLILSPPEVVAESNQIRIFSPAPGTAITDSIDLWGTAQVYESTVTYQVWAGPELIVESFTTVNDFDWGSFRENVPLPVGTSGDITLRVYSESAKDGSATFLVEIPLKASK